MGRGGQRAGQPQEEEGLKRRGRGPRQGRREVETRVVIRDNLNERTIELIGELDSKDVEFINEIGERVAQGTGWDVTVLAVEVEK